MSGPMTMNRVIHAAVRRDLARLQTALGEADDGDVARACELHSAYAHLHHQLKRHHEGEDTHVFPYFLTVEDASELAQVMESEHQRMADALDELDTVMDRYASTGSSSDAQAAQAAVGHAQEVVEQHLHHEEEEFEPLLQPHMATPEWKTVEKQLRPRSLTESGCFMAWVQDGVAEDARAHLRSTIPPPVTFLLSKVAGRAYHKRVAPTWQH